MEQPRVRGRVVPEEATEGPRCPAGVENVQADDARGMHEGVLLHAQAPRLCDVEGAARDGEQSGVFDSVGRPAPDGVGE
eukprot:2012648-Rhodomonas_salina.1